jgi:hypothetical protein
MGPCRKKQQEQEQEQTWSVNCSETREAASQSVAQTGLNGGEVHKARQLQAQLLWNIKLLLRRYKLLVLQ